MALELPAEVLDEGPVEVQVHVLTQLETDVKFSHESKSTEWSNWFSHQSAVP